MCDPFYPQHLSAVVSAALGCLKHDLKPIYTAPPEGAARAAFDDFTERWRRRYPAIIRLWTNAWQEFIPFLDYDIEIRRVLCSTNAIEPLNARYRRAVSVVISPPRPPHSSASIW